MPLAPRIDVLEEDLAEFGDAWLYFIRRAHQGDCRNGLACQVMDRRPERVAGTGQPDVLGDSGFPDGVELCLLYTSPSPRDKRQSRMPSSA